MKLISLLVNLLIFMVPAALMCVAARKWSRASRDEWKLLAWMPALPFAGWGVRIAWDVSRDPTSHNLWPFELFVWGGVTLLLVGLFLLARRALGGSHPADGTLHTKL